MSTFVTSDFKRLKFDRCDEDVTNDDDGVTNDDDGVDIEYKAFYCSANKMQMKMFYF